MGTLGPKQFIAKYRKKFHDTPIFSAVILGKTCHFPTSGDYLPLLYRHPRLNLLELQADALHRVFGASRQWAVEYVTNRELLEQYRIHLYDATELKVLEPVAQNRMQNLLKEYIEEQICNKGDNMVVSLDDLVNRIMFTALVGSTVSKKLEGCLLEHRTVDESVALVYAGFPRFMFPAATRARLALLDTQTDPAFIQEASNLIKEREKVFDKLNFPQKERNIVNAAILWAAVGQAVPSTFWLVYHILTDEEALSAIRDEIVAIISEKNDMDGIFTMSELDRMVCLESAFKESLRLHQNSMLPRDVPKDFVLELKSDSGSTKYSLYKGERIMALMTLLHRDPDIFVNPDSFVWNRFLPHQQTGETPSFRKNGKEVDGWRPFGGGPHLCPGRKFINYEMKAFVAMLLTQYHVQLAEGMSNVAPTLNSSREGLGIDVPGFDVEVELRRL